MRYTLIAALLVFTACATTEQKAAEAQPAPKAEPAPKPEAPSPAPAGPAEVPWP